MSLLYLTQTHILTGARLDAPETPNDFNYINFIFILFYLILYIYLGIIYIIHNCTFTHNKHKISLPHSISLKQLNHIQLSSSL